MSQNNNEDIAANMLGQIAPEDYNPNLSVMDNAYNFTGYANPVSGSPEGAALARSPLPTGAEEEPGIVEADSNDNIEEFYRDVNAEAEGDIIPAAFRAYANTENFGDNLGTAFQVHSAYLFGQLEIDWLAEALGSDIQFGFNAHSSRAGKMGVYGDYIGLEEMYGPNWQGMSREQMFAKRREFHAKQIEEYYSGVIGNKLGDGIGSVGSHILDVANLAPTGYVRAAALGVAKGLGKTTAHSLAGATVGAGWGAAATALDDYIQGEAMDPNRMMAGAALSGVVGAALPWVGAALNKVIGAARHNGLSLSLEDVTFKIDESLETLHKMKKHAEGLPIPKDAAGKVEAKEIMDELNKRISSIEALDPKALQQRVNDVYKKGKSTDAEEVISDALRMHAGKDYKDIQALKTFDDLYRNTPEKAIDNIKDTPVYKALDPESKAIVDENIKHRKGEAVPDKKKKPVKLSQSDIEAMKKENEELVDFQTEETMRTLGSHSKAYTQDVLRQVRNTTAGSAAGYAGGYLVTDDPEFAMYSAIAMGALPVGSKIGSRLLGHGSSKATQKLMSPSGLERKEGASILKASTWKGIYSGTNGFTNNNLTTVPFRQWMNRGGTSRVYGEKMRRAQEDANTSIAVTKTEFRSMLAELKIKPGEGEILSKLMAKTIPEDHPLVMPRHKEAVKRLRDMYNRELKELVKVKVLTKAQADEMIARAEVEGYLNRVYYTDYLRTKKGATAFHNALSKVEMTEKEAADIVSALTGVKRDKAITKLREYASKNNDGYVTFSFDGVRNMLRSSNDAGAQPARFIERERTLPTKLEKVLEPFLVRDIDVAFTKYIDSAIKRREFARQFGPNGEIAAAYAKKIGQEWKSDSLEKLAYQDYLGATHQPSKFLDAYFNQSQWMRNADLAVQHFQNSKLIASAPINFTQHLVYLPAYMAKLGLTSKIPTTMYKAYKEASMQIAEEVKLRGKVEGQGFMDTIGSMTDMMTYNATGEVLGTDGGAKLGFWKRMSLDPGIWLKAGGFAKVENWNRRVSGIVGKFIVEDTLNRKVALEAKQLRKSLSAKETRELADVHSRMIDFGLDPTIKEGDLSIAALEDAGSYVGGVLRDWREPEAVAAGAQRIASEVNFKSDYMNKPRYWNHPLGKWFGKFRSFVLHSHHFINDHIIAPINQGNTVPLAVMLTAGGAMAPIAQIKEILKNDDIERTRLQSVLHAQAQVGANGMIIEGAKQALEHPKGLFNYLGGPIVGDTSRLVEALATAASTQDTEKLAVDLLKMVGPVPYVAGAVSRAAGKDNPLATQQERDKQERARNLRIPQPTGYEGYKGY